MDGGTIAAIGPRGSIPDGDEVIEGPEFLMPGVVDRHVHIGLADPGAVVQGGVTAVRDLGWPPDAIHSMVEASEGPNFTGPLVRAVGAMITHRGGYPSRARWAPHGTALEIEGAEEAADAARAVLERGAIPVVKVALNSDAGPSLTDGELVAICDAAHAREAIVTAHVQGRGEAERAVGAGVDEFAHTPWSERLPDGLVQAMAGKVRIVSTLDILSYGHDTPELRVALDNLGRFLEAGGTVTYGTDLGNGPIPPGIHVAEARLLQRAGLSREQVLGAMTFRPIAEGEPADLVGLGADPLEDLSALGRLQLVIHVGRVVRRG